MNGLTLPEYYRVPSPDGRGPYFRLRDSPHRRPCVTTSDRKRPRLAHPATPKRVFSSSPPPVTPAQVRVDIRKRLARVRSTPQNRPANLPCMGDWNQSV